MRITHAVAALALSLALSSCTIIQKTSYPLPRVDRAGQIKASLDLTDSVEPDSEWRGVWVNSREIDSDEAVEKLVNLIDRANLNAIVTYGPWSYVDKTEKLLNERGIECEIHAWRANVTANPPKKEWALVKADGTIARDRAGNPDYNDMAKAAVREWHVEKMLQPFEDRPYVDGTHFDYIRYPNWRLEDRSWRTVGNTFCYCDHCRTEFEKEYGYDPIVFASSKTANGIRGSFTSAPTLSATPLPLYHPEDNDFIKQHQHEWDQWRKDQISKTVKAVHEAVEAEYPDRAITAAVFRDSKKQQGILQDAFKWLNNDWIDIAMPMNYQPDFDMWLESELDFLDRTDPEVHNRIFPGLGVHKIQDADGSPEDLMAQIHAGRQLGMRGFVFFQASSFLKQPEYVEALREGPFKKRAKIYRPWK